MQGAALEDGIWDKAKPRLGEIVKDSHQLFPFRKKLLFLKIRKANKYRKRKFSVLLPPKIIAVYYIFFFK